MDKKTFIETFSEYQRQFQCQRKDTERRKLIREERELEYKLDNYKYDSRDKHKRRYG